MKTKFTPGPWAYTKSVRDDGDVCFDVHQVEIDRKWVLNSDVAYSRLFKTYVAEYLHVQEANARLIAAAPCLLAELQNIANANPKNWDAPLNDSASFQAWAQSRARAAIAKATGVSA